jgi:LPS export ABC transporter protein LptC
MSLFKTRNLFLLLALLLAVGLAAVVALRYRPEVKVAEVVKALPEGVDLALKDIDYTHSEGGVSRWRLVARQVAHRGSEGLMSVSDLHLTFFDAQGVEQGTLEARNGQISADFSAIEVRDEVTVTSHNGYTLRTDHLAYRQQERTIRTDSPVRLTGRGLDLEGVGLDLDLQTMRLRVHSKVRARLQPSGKREHS